MAGLLNLIPRYLPRYGMAPEWAGAVRPLVVVLTMTAFLITWIFDADVDAQGGAYATGVLVLFTSAGVAVTLAARRAGQRWWTVGFAVITAVFAYTTVANVIERPDGLQIALCFIAAILGVSFASRLRRAFELRATGAELDATAQVFVRDCARRTIRLVAHESGSRERRGLRRQDRPDPPRPRPGPGPGRHLRRGHGHRRQRLRVAPGGARRGAARAVPGRHDWRPRRCRTRSPRCCCTCGTCPGSTPHIYFEWTEGNPVKQLLRFLLFGQGEVAPVTREVLRRAEPDRARRPHVHVG